MPNRPSRASRASETRRASRAAIPGQPGSTAKPDQPHASDRPVAIDAVINPLGSVDPARFLASTWQKRPLLIRGAIPAPALAKAFPIRDVLALARDPDVESRLVEAPSADGRHGWRLRPGPFTRLPSRQRPGWTVLVQGVDLHWPAGRALVDQFRFIPDARIDDLMISVAADGGGVGPHVDSYDVFLIQAHGRRRWRVGPPATRRSPHRLAPGQPLKILEAFRPTETWTLEAGDLLYLPPGWSHEGTAVGNDCMTCSVGFRSPSPVELRQAFFAALADAPPADLGESTRPSVSVVDTSRYRDPTGAPTTTPARIPPDMLGTLTDWIRAFRPDDATIQRFIGCYLTEPKPSVWFDAPDDAGGDVPERGRAQGPDGDDGATVLSPSGLALDRRTRMLYSDTAVYINGDVLTPPRRSLVWLRRLADQRALDAADAHQAMQDPHLQGTLQDWIATGWVHLADD